MGQSKSKSKRTHGIILKVVINETDINYYRLSPEYIPILEYINRNTYRFVGATIHCPSHKNGINDDISMIIWAFRNDTCGAFANKIKVKPARRENLPRDYEIFIRY